MLIIFYILKKVIIFALILKQITITDLCFA